MKWSLKKMVVQCLPMILALAFILGLGWVVERLFGEQTEFWTMMVILAVCFWLLGLNPRGKTGDNPGKSDTWKSD